MGTTLPPTAVCDMYRNVPWIGISMKKSFRKHLFVKLKSVCAMNYIYLIYIEKTLQFYICISNIVFLFYCDMYNMWNILVSRKSFLQRKRMIIISFLKPHDTTTCCLMRGKQNNMQTEHQVRIYNILFLFAVNFVMLWNIFSVLYILKHIYT